SARTQTDGAPISYQAGGDLWLAQVESAEGTVSLSNDGIIESVFAEEQTNITAQRLEVASGSGIGNQQRLLTEVKELSLTNQRGRVAVTNTGTVRIERMASNGNVSLRSLEGDVELDSREGPIFDLEERDAIRAGGTLSANYQQGTVSIFVDKGSLLALGTPHSHKPDLVGRRGNIIVAKDIGTAARPLVMYFQDSVFMNGLRSWSPEWAFGDPPPTVENQSSLKMSDFDLLMSGADYLIQV
ncbi:hypothetical protein, partial [Marinimicrobium locisalis]|uniref:hypothetical protein n=1 Tax=Marinimicrobium locisalis TaxID=546022 RepID=UPI00322223AE